MGKLKKIFIPLIILLTLYFTGTVNSGCKIYKFADVSIPDSIKTVRIRYIENNARYVNPQISPQLTDKLRQKIVSQTRLTQVNNENADYDISGKITDYSVSTSAISGQQAATNRLTVSVSITLRNNLTNEPDQDYSVTRSFDFSATLSLAQAEANLTEEIIRNLTDEIFNRIFSNW